MVICGGCRGFRGRKFLEAPHTTGKKQRPTDSETNMVYGQTQKGE